MVASPSPVTVLRGHRKGVQTCTFHPDGTSRLFFSGDTEGNLKLWDLDKRRAQAEHRAYAKDQGLLCVKVCAGDERKLLTQGREGEVKLWDIERLSSSGESRSEGEGDCISRFSSGSYNFCRFSSIAPTDEYRAQACCSAKTLVSIPGSDSSVVEIWEVHNSKLSSQLKAPRSAELGMCMALCLKAAPNTGTMLAWAGYESGAIACWDLKRPLEPLSISKFSEEPLMAIDVDNTAYSGVHGGAGSDIIMFRSSQRKQGGDGAEHPNACGGATAVKASHKFQIKGKPGISDLSVRSDKRIFASAGWDGHVRVYDYKKRVPLAVLKYHQKTCNSLSFSYDNSWLASASQDCNIALWAIYPPKK